MTDAKFDEAIASVMDITNRAEAMKLGLAKYPVAEIRQLVDKFGDIHVAFYRVRSLEWSGRTRGPGTSMGAENGEIMSCCPVCRGLEHAGGGFIPSAQGHRPDCWMGDLVKGDLV